MQKYSKIIGVLTVVAIASSMPGSAAGKPSVFVSINPQKYFVQRIGKDLVDIQVMVQPGASPASYEPKPRQMAAIAKTLIYFSIGVPFENVWLNKIASSNPNMMVESKKFPWRPIITTGRQRIIEKPMGMLKTNTDKLKINAIAASSILISGYHHRW